MYLVCRLLLDRPTTEIDTLSLHGRSSDLALRRSARRRQTGTAVVSSRCSLFLARGGLCPVALRWVHRCDWKALVRAGRRPRNRCGRSERRDRKSTRLNSSHRCISYAVFCLIGRPLRLTLFPYTDALPILRFGGLLGGDKLERRLYLRVARYFLRAAVFAQLRFDGFIGAIGKH